MLSRKVKWVLILGVVGVLILVVALTFFSQKQPDKEESIFIGKDGSKVLVVLSDQAMVAHIRERLISSGWREDSSRVNNGDSRQITAMGSKPPIVRIGKEDESGADGCRGFFLERYYEMERGTFTYAFSCAPGVDGFVQEILESPLGYIPRGLPRMYTAEHEPLYPQKPQRQCPYLPSHLSDQIPQGRDYRESGHGPEGNMPRALPSVSDSLSRNRYGYGPCPLSHPVGSDLPSDEDRSHREEYHGTRDLRPSTRGEETAVGRGVLVGRLLYLDGWKAWQ